MISIRPRRLLTAFAALALGFTVWLAPIALPNKPVRLASSPNAKKSTSTRKTARKALRLARKADKRSRDALAAALAPVISQSIVDETITAADIAADAVESSEIAEGAVGSPEIGDGVVGSAEIADGAVGSSEIAEGAVGGSQIADGSVTGAEIAVGAVSSIELADESVQSADIFDETIASADIQDETIATFDILDNTIASVDILEGTIATGDISQSVWSDSVHAAGLLTNRPAAAPSNNGFLFFATDDSGGTLYRSNGSTWVTISPGVDRLATSISMAFGGTWDNMPSALTEFMGTAQNRTRYDLTEATVARITVNVVTAGASTPAKIRAEYSIDGSSWSYLDGGSGPSVDVGSPGLETSSWVSLAPQAKADVYLRVIGLDGDDTADPTFGRIDIQAR